MRRLFAANGFEVLDVDSEYDRQYLTIEARPDGSADPQCEVQEDSDLEEFRGLVTTFPKRCQKLLAEWDRRLRAWAAEEAKVVLWGSGSKGVAFLTTLSVGSRIEYVVDINPFRAKHFMPGGGQLIVAPEFLRDYRPDVVIVMNSIYCREISEALSELGVAAEVRSIH